MFRKISALSLCLVLALPLTACAAKPAPADGKIKVSVTFDAMKEFTEAVGGDKVDISTIIPDGEEPHDFEPKPKDLVGISGAKVLVYNGMGMEAWIDEAINAAGNSSLVAVDASEGVAPITDTDSSEESERGQDDPHVWISLKGAETEARNIEKGLSKADPKNAAYYEKNCSAFTAQLDGLYKTYAAKFKQSPRKDFVTGHAAFAYLCRDFGLKQESVEDVFADGEPSAQKLKELIDYCRQSGVKTVFVEDMVSPAVSKTLADSVGAKVETIYTIESSENGKSYLSRMKANLEEIENSLA